MKTIRPEKANFNQIRGFISTAKIKIDKSEKIVKIDEQAGFQIAYEAMLRASLGFMLSFGVRPRSGVGHHKVIIEFVSGKLGKEYSSIMRTFDVMRRKRNESIYEPLSSITQKEAKDAIEVARKYLKIISENIELRNPQQKLF